MFSTVLVEKPGNCAFWRNPSLRSVEQMAKSVNLGMPRIGPDRELKRVIEAYWKGTADEDRVREVARTLRAAAWSRQREAGIDEIPSHDFSLYDQMLDTTCMVGAVPSRFGLDAHADRVDLDTYFAMGRGAGSIQPLEMTKWFDTNYHYLVPELGPETAFRLTARDVVDEFEEALALGIVTRPVLIGPVTYLLLAKTETVGFSTLDLLSGLVRVYEQVLAELGAAGADWVQFDEPCLATDLDDATRAAYVDAYRRLAGASSCRLLLATYFGGLGDHAGLAFDLPVDGVHIDLVRDPDQLTRVLDLVSPSVVLSLGLVDGRNVWRTDLSSVLDRLDAVAPTTDRHGDDLLWIGPSCSLQHVPHDVELEADLDPRVRSWLSFAVQKLDEVATITRAVSSGRGAVSTELAASDAVADDRRRAAAAHPDGPQRRVADRSAADATRRSPYDERRVIQDEALRLPPLPTTTIGSFPQTDEIRRARQQHLAGRLSDVEYRGFCAREIEHVIRQQELLGLDVLVHGEPERNDMVQYFGERLAGFAATRFGWVQSYGTRCVRPPILHGDVERPSAMTVEWATFAQSLTPLPVKGMLTGPVTILQWSFVRDDQPRADSCRQIAYAIRDEVTELAAAGIGIVQVDEPALREGLPLRRSDWDDYLDWATESFRIATSGVEDRTQIHTHMCYAEFGDILDAVRALDADVISLEAARSGFDMIDRLADAGYPSGVGPGVYDIHAPRVPTEDEMAAIVERALLALHPEQLWVNPDCGLKTRGWPEVTTALHHMVQAARRVRKERS